MVLTLDIPEEQVERLDRLRQARGASREQLVREALDVFLPGKSVLPQYQNPGPATLLNPEQSRILDEAFGSWKHLAEDAVDYQRCLRNEWER